MTMLGGDVAAMFGELLDTEFFDAVIPDSEQTRDLNGNLTIGENDDDACKAIVSKVTQRMREDDGYSATDVGITILATTVSGAVKPEQKITFSSGPHNNKSFQLGTPIYQDPAGAYWMARGTET